VAQKRRFYHLALHFVELDGRAAVAAVAVLPRAVLPTVRVARRLAPAEYGPFPQLVLSLSRACLGKHSVVATKTTKWRKHSFSLPAALADPRRARDDAGGADLDVLIKHLRRRNASLSACPHVCAESVVVT
jgi:hypothetical protein